MHATWVICALVVCAPVLGKKEVIWTPAKCKRTQLAQKNVSPQLQAYIDAILAGSKTARVPDEVLTDLAPVNGPNNIGPCEVRQKITEQTVLNTLPKCETGSKAGKFYARLIDPRFAFKQANKEYVQPLVVLPDAKLGTPTRQLVFMGSPEMYFGKSLFEIMMDVGYAANGVLKDVTNYGELAVPKILIIYRYPDDKAQLMQVPSGSAFLDFQNKMFRPTWENCMQLLSLLADDNLLLDNKGNKASDDIKALARNYKGVGKDDVLRRLKNRSYTSLMAFGTDVVQDVNNLDKVTWEYRQLLESNLAAYIMFGGTGVTKNDLDESGVPEFIGPNFKLNDLEEYAIIDVGALQVDDHVETGGDLCSPLRLTFEDEIIKFFRQGKKTIFDLVGIDPE